MPATQCQQRDLFKFEDELNKSRSVGNQEVEQFYDDWATEYETLIAGNGYTDLNKFVADALVKQLDNSKHHLGDMKILDVACGTGLGGVALKNAGIKHIHGIDMAEGMLKVAKEKQSYEKLSQGVINEQPLNLPANSFNGVLCIGGISRSQIDPNLGIREFIRLTKPGGYCVYTIYDMKNELQHIEVHGQVVREGLCDIVRLEKHPHFKKGDKWCYTYFCLIKVL